MARSNDETDEEIGVELRGETPAERDTAIIEETILAAFDQADENVVWDCRVKKLNGSEEEDLFSCQPDELDGLMDRVRDSEGTGKYRVRVYRKQGAERKIIFKTFDFRVKAPNRPPQQSTDLSAVLQAINASNERTQRLLERLITNPPAALQAPAVPVTQTSPFAMMKEMLDAMSSMRGSLMPREGSSAVDLIVKGVELANNLRGEPASDREPGMMDLVRDLLKSPLVEAFAKQVQQPPAGQVIQQPQPAMLQPSAPSQSSNRQEAANIQQPNGSQAPGVSLNLNDQNNVVQIRAALLYLNSKAQKAAPPEFYAEWVFDEWPPQMITAVLQQPNIIALIQQLAPETIPYGGWFEKLIAEMRGIVNDAQEGTASDVRHQFTDASPVYPVGDTGGRTGGESDIEGDE